ncbi:MAG: FAA hydrolase family protein, partial [Pelagibacteraceae bacterium]|nr:FAA hydrolase family protein [Pelagibacteraceae bacterium]
MKLLRVGNKGNERPAIIDKNGKVRELSSQIKDLSSDNLNFETIFKLKNIDLEKLPELPKTDRIGPCVEKPGKFVAIGLNYSDHAAE